MPPRIVIQTGSSTPIYRQIAEQIRLAVASGRLRVEDSLPSVRALAEELVVNPNTVARAYAELAREGVVDARAGLGVFIARKRKMYTRTEGRRRLEPLLRSLIGEAMVLDFSPEELREAFEEQLADWRPAKAEKGES
jgi:GntR family transcriptional regulator